MDLTQGTKEEKNNRAKKMMLWFGLISLIMSFMGWTSAYIVSRTRPDWLSELELPDAFVVSLVVILLSSLTFILAKRALKSNNRQLTTIWLVATLFLGVVFVLNQFSGFQQLIDSGNYVTGPTSNPKASFIYVIAFAHILHVAIGLICISVVLYKHLNKKYSPSNMLGFELAATFWHFVDILWLYLFLFLYFVK